MDKKGYYIMIERSILQEEIINLNMYAPNYKPSANKSENAWAKTDRTERVRDISTTTIEEANTAFFSVTGGSSR